MQEALTMPATQFFLMLKAARYLDAANKADLADIQAISICNSRYHETVKNYFNQQMAVQYPKPFMTAHINGPVFESSSPETKEAIFDIFRKMKRSN